MLPFTEFPKLNKVPTLVDFGKLAAGCPVEVMTVVELTPTTVSTAREQEAGRGNGVVITKSFTTKEEGVATSHWVAVEFPVGPAVVIKYPSDWPVGFP